MCDNTLTLSHNTSTHTTQHNTHPSHYSKPKHTQVLGSLGHLPLMHLWGDALMPISPPPLFVGVCVVVVVVVIIIRGGFVVLLLLFVCLFVCLFVVCVFVLGG